MPPLPKLRTPVMAELVRQVRFGGRAALNRQIEAAEALVTDINPEQVYPEDWLLFRVLGYRADLETTTHQETTGAEILTDLSALAEHLCDTAKLTQADLPQNAKNRADLAEHFSVSIKTLDRWRKRGLIARRVIGPSGRDELWFTPAAIERFQQIAPDAINRASNFKRTDSATGAALIEAARELHAKHNWSAFRCAEHLAKESPLSTEGIRLILLRHDRRARTNPSTSSPVFPPPASRTARTRAEALRRYSKGEEPSKIAQALEPRLNTKPDTARITRLINTARANLLRRLDLAGPTSPVFDRDDAPSVLLDHPAVTTNLAAAADYTDLPSMLARYRNTRPAEPDTERARLLAYHYLRARSSRAIQTLSKAGEPYTTLDNIETDLRWAILLRTELIRDQMGVALAAVENAAAVPIEQVPAATAADAIAQALNAAAHAIDRFAPFRGGRLAGAVGLAIQRTLAPLRAEADHAGRATRSLAAGTPVTDFTTLAPAPAFAWQPRLIIHPQIRAALTRLDPLERSTLERRTGLDTRPPATLAELAKHLATTRMAAARAMRRALRNALKTQPAN